MLFGLTRIQAQWMTLGFILLITAIVVGYDFWTYQANGVNSTISRVCKRAFTASPATFAAFIFWLGILCGHCWLHTE